MDLLLDDKIGQTAKIYVKKGRKLSMTVKTQVEKAIEDMTYLDKKFPEEGFKVLSENPEEAIPYLMDALEKAIEEKDELAEGYQLHFYGLFLLAQFGYEPAFPVVLKMISLPDDVLDCLIGDMVTEGLRDVLYSIYDGDFQRLRDYIVNTECSGFAKSEALDVCTQLYLDGVLEKSDLVNLLKDLIYHPVIEDEYQLDTSMIGSICKCHFAEMLEDIGYLYGQDRIERMVYGDYDSCVDFMFNYEKNERDICRKIESTADYLRHWAMFEQPEREKSSKKDLEKLMLNMAKGINQNKKKEKIYPNDSCPCGSGKKYKKCCMNKTEEESEIQVFKEDRSRWLKGYPSKKELGVEGRIYLEDYFDQESIEIDTLLYLALRRRPMLLSGRETEAEMKKRQRMYLQEAFSKYTDKCSREGIPTFAAYDSKYMIHYKSDVWMEYLIRLLKEEAMGEEYRKVEKFCSSKRG